MSMDQTIRRGQSSNHMNLNNSHEANQASTQRRSVNSGNNNEESEQRTSRLRSEEKEDDDTAIAIVGVVRLLCLILWTGSILYATYHVYLAAEEYLQWNKIPILNPGPFTTLLNRGRDVSDFEWRVFSEVLCHKLVPWYLVYLIISRIAHHHTPQHLASISAAVCYFFLWNLIGIWPTTFLYSQPVMYWLLIRLRRKYLIWPTTMLYLMFLNTSFSKQVVLAEDGIPSYYFYITAAWNVARCVSFSFDTWERDTNNLSSLISFFQYCFYFPLAINGPLILYETYERSTILKQAVTKRRTDTVHDVIILVKKFLRLLFWITVIELLLHYLYFRPLALANPVLFEINFWALCGIVYWLGQFFQMKYVVMYGIPTAMAEFEGMQMPPLPKCISYIHRYSVLWKDFDRGLYYFLVRYTYLPSLEFVTHLDTRNYVNPEFRKLIASFASFTYVYVWHSVSYDVFIWAAFNFLGITIERVGSFIKRKIDSTYHVTPLVWDVVVEPIMTIPLAVMSVLNSAVFCGTLDFARIANERFWTETNYVLHFFYLFTHVGVAMRTWPIFYPKLQRIYSNYRRNLAK